MSRLIRFSLSAVCIAVLFSSAAFSSPNAAGSKLSGQVRDEAGALVRAAKVTISSREGFIRVAMTDADGRYSFGTLAAGNYLVQVEAANFSPQTQSVTLGASEDRELPIDLRVAEVSEQVVVTAAGTPQAVDEISKSLNVIDSQTIEQRDDSSIADAVRTVPGLRTETLGGPGSFSKIFIRGLRVADTSVLIDGIRVRDAADTTGSITPFLGDLLTNNIDRIEVLRGSGSSLYGSNAVGGVVNIVPSIGAGSPRASFGFEGGSLGQLRENAKLSGGLGRSGGFSLAATRFDMNDGVLGGDIYRNTSVGGHAQYAIRPNISVRSTVAFADGFNRLTDSPFPIGPKGNEFGFGIGGGPVTGFVSNQVNPDSFRFSDFFAGSVTLTHQVSSIYSYSFSYQSAVTDQTFDNGPDQSQIAKQLGLFEFPGKFVSGGRIHTINWTNVLRAGRYNLITAGLEAERESFSQAFTSPFFSSPRTIDRQHSLAFFGQDQISLLDGRFQISAAFRTQGFAIPNPQSVPGISGIDGRRALTGDGSIAYFIRRSGTKLRAHAGNSFRAPSLSERFQFFRGQRIGNPFLRPERGLSFDAGFDQSALKGKVRFSASYFYNRLQEIITSTALFHEENSRGALARGLELSVEASPVRGLSFESSYTLAAAAQVLPDSILRDDNVRLPAGASTQSFSIPKHTYSFAAHQRLSRGFDFDFNFYAVSKHDFPLFDPLFFSQVLFTFKGYARSDLGVSYTRSIGEERQFTIYTKINNVFNRTIIDEGFRTPGAAAVGGIKFRF